jgi:hypothetical protein
MGEKGKLIITNSCLYASACGMIYFSVAPKRPLKAPVKAGNTILRQF